jgi:ABC-type transporter Mla subunit MlaD
MTTPQQRDLLRVIETQIQELLRDVGTSDDHVTTSDTALRDTMQPLRDLMDGLDRAYAANRAAHEQLQAYVRRALTITAAVAGLLRENGDR